MCLKFHSVLFTSHGSFIANSGKKKPKTDEPGIVQALFYLKWHGGIKEAAFKHALLLGVSIKAWYNIKVLWQILRMHGKAIVCELQCEDAVSLWLTYVVFICYTFKFY